MNDIVKELNEKNLKNITDEKIWKRNCPKCYKDLVYVNKESFRVAKKRNSICISCANTKHIPPFIRKCPKCKKEMVYDKYGSYVYSVKHDGWCHKCAGEKTIKTRIKRKNLYGNRNQSKYSKRKMSILHRRQGNPFYGRNHSDMMKRFLSEHFKSLIRTPEWKRKQRLARIKNIRLLHGNYSPSYNKKSCEYFKKMELEKRWNGYYATKNGEYHIEELGYWVDYYEPTNNVVIEWDEPTHYNIDNELRLRDYTRMLEIKDYLKCKFFRFNEKLNELKEY